MSVAGIFNLGSAEIILILAMTLILTYAEKSPEIGQGLRTGIEEQRKQTPEVRQGKEEKAVHPLLMAITIILGATCLTLVLYEFSK